MKWMKWLIRVTDWERASILRRLLVAGVRVALGVALATALVDLLGPPISIFWMARSVANRFPGVRVVPRPLADSSISSGQRTKVVYFGYEFDVPWNDAFKTRGGKANIVLLQFESGQNLTFIVPTDQNGVLAEICQDRSMNLGALQPVFGDVINESAYNQYAVLLNATPESVRAFGPRVQASRALTLLFVKAVATGPALPTGVFSFQFQDKRGFQLGDPQKSQRVDLEIFGMGGHYVEMVLYTEGNATRLSQPEINRLLSSLRRIEADPDVPANVEPKAMSLAH